MPKKLFLLHGIFQLHQYQKNVYEKAVALSYFWLISFLHDLSPNYVQC